MSSKKGGGSKRGTPRGHLALGYNPTAEIGSRFAVQDIGVDNGLTQDYLTTPVNPVIGALNNYQKQYNLQVDPLKYGTAGSVPTLRVEGSTNNMSDFISDILGRGAFSAEGTAGNLLGSNKFSSFDNFSDALAYGTQFDQLQQAGYDMTALPQYNPTTTNNYNSLQSAALSSGRRASSANPATALGELRDLASKGYRGNYVQGFR